VAEALVKLKEAAVGPSYIVLPPQLTIEDIADLRYDRSHSLYRIPFGPGRGHLTIRNLVKMDWKGRKGDDFIDVAKKHGALLAGNELARKISQAYAGKKGVVWVKVRDPITGEEKMTAYPRKALMQKNWRDEHPELVELYNAHIAGKTKAAKPKLRFVILPA